jgi:hypothetical protein
VHCFSSARMSGAGILITEVDERSRNHFRRIAHREHECPPAHAVDTMCWPQQDRAAVRQRRQLLSQALNAACRLGPR